MSKVALIARKGFFLLGIIGGDGGCEGGGGNSEVEILL
jgi:hypothetical protein